MCRKSFVNARQVNAHYNTSHGIAFHQMNLEFETFDKFQEWKRHVEREDITYFAKERGSRITSKSTLIQYICHRSGTYKDKSAGRRRKRFLKLSGSKKLQAHCPARMRVKIDAQSGVCKVVYQETHCGHKVKDANELCHVYLTKDDKTELASDIKAGVPMTRLKKRLYLSNAGDAEKAGRLTLAKCEGLTDDEHGVNAWIERSRESVLYHKARGVPDTKHGLERDDFAVVLMDDDQAANIRMYGHKVICFDSTYDTNPYGFVLHTMMVLNLWCESVPVAFLIANRNDKSVIDVFLKCVHERLGVVRTRVFMSDMQQTYLNSWIEVMDHFPEYCLYCPWHVHEAWRRNYAKITNKDTRMAVIKRLNELAVELDPVKFETMLGDFTSANDPHAAKFLRYFVKNFTDNIPCWAFCYRHNLGLYTNMHPELFYRILKRNVGDGNKVKTLTQCLQQLQEYLAARLNEDKLLKDVRSQTTYKLRVLRQKHHRAADYLEKTPVHVESIDSNTFLVQSFAESQPDDENPKMYTVTKRKSKECVQLGVTCLLVCDACKICFHEYYCDCLDSGIKSNMCKHIHAIGITNCAAVAKIEESEATTATIVESVGDDEIPMDGTDLPKEIRHETETN